MRELHIFTGHYGSGKTEVSVNFAAKLRREGKKVTIIDLDTVNPYFRTNDLRKRLEDMGIEVIAGRFASTNVDMPLVPAEISKAFNSDGCFIFDVGGDDEGAYALGRYTSEFEKSGYEMHLVVNTRRPLTSTAEEICAMAADIEKASRLKITDIYNNTNLSYETDKSTVMSGIGELKRAEELTGLKIARHCGTAEAVSEIPSETAFEMEIYLKLL